RRSSPQSGPRGGNGTGHRLRPSSLSSPGGHGGCQGVFPEISRGSTGWVRAPARPHRPPRFSPRLGTLRPPSEDDPGGGRPHDRPRDERPSNQPRSDPMRRRSTFSLKRLEARDTPSTVALSAAIVPTPAAVHPAGDLTPAVPAVQSPKIIAI